MTSDSMDPILNGNRVSTTSSRDAGKMDENEIVDDNDNDNDNEDTIELREKEKVKNI